MRASWRQQAVEHYQISRYGTLKTWASELGLSEAVKLLDEARRKWRQ
jgi:ferritin-like metal-binding protein YciE